MKTGPKLPILSNEDPPTEYKVKEFKVKLADLKMNRFPKDCSLAQAQMQNICLLESMAQIALRQIQNYEDIQFLGMTLEDHKRNAKWLRFLEEIE